jgi:hypothetical protein
MGLLKKIFGGGSAGARPGGPASSQYHESETTEERGSSANAPRRELVQVVLRDTMRKHAVPSDWIDCRILSVVTRQHKSGMHVQLVVRQGGERLLEYVHPFQQTFWEELEKFEPKPREWLFSLAWQVDSDAPAGAGALPGLEAWDDDTQPPEDDRRPADTQPHAREEPRRPPADTQPQEDHPEELASDLQALYAAMSQPAELGDAPPAPAPRRGPGRS